MFWATCSVLVMLTGIEKRLTEAEQKMENLLSQLATAQEEVEKPFPKEAELTEKWNVWQN